VPGRSSRWRSGAGAALRGGVAPEPRGVAEEGDRDLAAAGREAAGRDEAVAAVVAGACHHENRTLRHKSGGRARHGPAGRLHQRLARRAGGDGASVGLGHLGGGE
jgi:hypothetical protein